MRRRAVFLGCLISLLASGATTTHRVQTNVGDVAAVVVEGTWVDDGPKDGHHSLRRPATATSACFGLMRVSPSFPAPASRALSSLLKLPAHHLTLAEASQLRALLEPGVSDEYSQLKSKFEGSQLSVATQNLNGRRVLVVSDQGSVRGPCEWMPDGSREWATLAYVSRTFLFVARDGGVQALLITAETPDSETAECSKVGATALASIDWRK